MSEVIVSLVVERIANLVTDQTISFISTFTRAYEQFDLLRIELQSIQAFLNTADLYHNQNPNISTWVANVREIAYDVDDVIDAFLRKVVSKEEEESSNTILKRYVYKLKKIFYCYKLGKEMEKIFSNLKAISKAQKRYAGITTALTIPASTSTNTNNRMLRRVYTHTKDDVTIGLEEQINALVFELLKEEDRLCVVSICGMGGSGKTTLAKETYNHRDVKNHFDCCGWTSISQQMSTREVLKEILRKVSTLTSKDMGEMEEVELVGKLYAIMDGKRYLVVLDDIWSTEAWDILKPAFPNNKGSKVMLTTRNSEVAFHADPRSRRFEPRLLTDDRAWELFCTKALPPPLSSDHEECGRNMVKKCGGLPLAIIVLGGILQSKRSLDEWEVVSNKVVRGESRDLSILSLSYMELPYHLKPLFLYLGLFPEDSNIPVKKLVHMWMAESLIKGQEGETMEELGREYLDELINRCMVQIGKKSRGGQRAKTCRLHDKMRDLCIDIGKTENFFEVISHQNRDSASSSSSVCSKLRRCAIYIEEEGEQYVFPKHLTPCLRTVFFIKNGWLKFCLNMVYKDFKLLKVLVFEGYLNLGDGNEVCEVLSKLSNLRYLEVTYCDIKNLMCNELHQLRHLYGHVNMEFSQIKKMTKLQTFYDVSAGPWITDLRDLKNLEKLRIINGFTKETMRLLTIAIGGGGLDKLRSLYLKGCYYGEPKTQFSSDLLDASFTVVEFSSDLLEALCAKHHLKKLNLDGIIEKKKLPSLFPSNLIKLSLRYNYLSEDPMPTLEKLQHLFFLQLWTSYSGKEMVCSANGFPKLQHLEIRRFSELEEWIVEEGAMPCLTTCEINDCYNLKMVPSGFKSLTMLQELRIIDMPESFEQRVKEGGEDWETIKHIPSITVRRIQLSE